MTFSTAGMTATHRTLQARRAAWTARLDALEREALALGIRDRQALRDTIAAIRAVLDRTDGDTVRLSLSRDVADRIVSGG